MIGFKISPVAETHNANVILSLLFLCPSGLLLLSVVDGNNLSYRQQPYEEYACIFLAS
jgi:hypothetical protein